MISFALVMLVTSLVMLIVALLFATAELLIPFFAAMIIIWLSLYLYRRWFKKDGP